MVLNPLLRWIGLDADQYVLDETGLLSHFWTLLALSQRRLMSIITCILLYSKIHVMLDTYIVHYLYSTLYSKIHVMLNAQGP